LSSPGFQIFNFLKTWLQVVFSPLVLPLLTEAVEGKDAAVKMRVFEVTVRIAKTSAQMTDRYTEADT
jgi:hypothetical protein